MKKLYVLAEATHRLAAIETVRIYGRDNVILLNHDISSHVEHEDIKRFKHEIADYLGLPITYANMDGWETTPPLLWLSNAGPLRHTTVQRFVPPDLRQSRSTSGWRSTGIVGIR